MSNNDYLIKLQESTSDYLSTLNEPVILEFGVRHGISTEFFLKFCEKKNGFLYSVDMDDSSKKFNLSIYKDQVTAITGLIGTGK